MVNNVQTVDIASQLLFDKLDEIVTQNVPTVKIKKHLDPPWFNKSINQ